MGPFCFLDAVRSGFGRAAGAGRLTVGRPGAGAVAAAGEYDASAAGAALYEVLAADVELPPGIYTEGAAGAAGTGSGAGV